MQRESERIWTAQEMGLDPAAHIQGGFGAWVKSGGPVEQFS